MSRLRILFVFFSLALAQSVQAESVTLVTSDTNEEPHYSTALTLAPGDLAELIYSDLELSVEVKISDHTFEVDSGGSGSYERSLTFPKIAGPAELRVFLPSQTRPYYQSYALLSTFKITRAAAAAGTVPSTAVVIPEDAEGQFEVILESSTDMLNWTATMPGTYGRDTVKRFFRTRIVRKA